MITDFAAAFRKLTDAYRELTDVVLLFAYALSVAVAASRRGEYMCGADHAELGSAGCSACKARR